MATAYRVIQRGLRPDGTPRKPLRVKEGYVPPDEAEAYVPPHKTGQTNSETPMGFQYDKLPIEDIHLAERPKTKAQIKNERKNKNKREKKLVNHTKQFDNSETTNDHLFAKGFDQTSLDDDASQNGMTSEKLKTVQPASPDFVVYKSRDISSSTSAAKKGSASQQNEINEESGVRALQLEKEQKKIMKKLEQIEKLVKKGDGLNAEEVIKVEKKGTWEQEIKEIGKQLRALETK